MADLSGSVTIFSVAPGGSETEQVLTSDIDEVILSTAAADATIAALSGGTQFLLPQNRPLHLKGANFGGRSIYLDSAAGTISILCIKNPVTD